MGFLDLLLLGAVLNGLNKKDNKRTNNFTQSSSYNYGYEDGYEDGHNSHTCECDNYHDSYESCDYNDCDCDYDY